MRRILSRAPDNPLQRLGHFNGRSQIHRGIQDSRRVAGFHSSPRRLGKQACQAGRFPLAGCSSSPHTSRPPLHKSRACPVPRHGRSADSASRSCPSHTERSLPAQQLVNIAGHQVRDPGFDLNLAVHRPILRRAASALGRQPVVGFVKQHLALQIAFLHEVAVDQGQRATPALASRPAAAAPVAPTPTTATWARSIRACPSGPIPRKVLAANNARRRLETRLPSGQ